MKPHLLKLATEPECSFNIRRDRVPSNNSRWHYHQEVELIYFRKGSGTQFIGDHISRFTDGDVMMVGPSLPHYWSFDDSYLEGGEADILVLHFNEDFWGPKFLQLPENKAIKLLMDNSRRGLMLTDTACRQTVTELLEKLLTASGPLRVLLLLRMLSVFANCRQHQLLSSIGFRYHIKEAESDRINAIYQYSMANFRNKIQLEDIASIAHICPNSFCRYFKARTKKTYSQFLIEIKVGNACKLLIENKMSIKQLCVESGFNSFSSFHKYFKKITGKSPATYKSEFMNHARNIHFPVITAVRTAV